MTENHCSDREAARQAAKKRFGENLAEIHRLMEGTTEEEVLEALGVKAATSPKPGPRASRRQPASASTRTASPPE